MKKGKVVVLGTLAGLAIGALSGVLFAPEKGANTRNQIKDKSNQFMDELKSKFNRFRVSLTGKLEKAERDAEYLAGKGKAKYDEVKKDVKNTASEYKHSVS